jgi:hypothetical protein
MSRIEERIEQKARDRMTGKSYELTVSDDMDIVRLCQYVAELREELADTRKWMTWATGIMFVAAGLASFAFGLWLRCGGA